MGIFVVQQQAFTSTTSCGSPPRAGVPPHHITNRPRLLFCFYGVLGPARLTYFISEDLLLTGHERKRTFTREKRQQQRNGLCQDNLWRRWPSITTSQGQSTATNSRREPLASAKARSLLATPRSIFSLHLDLVLPQEQLDTRHRTYRTRIITNPSYKRLLLPPLLPNTFRFIT